MVMPMCSNGIKDIFEKKPWNFEEYATWCQKTYQVQPSIDIIEKIYGGKNLNGVSNIIFRYIDLYCYKLLSLQS